MKKYSVIGKDLPRKEGPLKAGGKALFTSDMTLPGMLLGKRTHLVCIVFSPLDWIEDKLTGSMSIAKDETSERGDVRASHPQLEPLARLLSGDRRDFDRHEGFFAQVAPEKLSDTK